MSENSEFRKVDGNRARADRRVLRTRDRLGDALIVLMQEMPFDDITVQHVLDRAGISRSTFYAHYRDKDDLLLSDVEEFWELMATLLDRCGANRERVAPVRELFAHVAEMKQLRLAFASSGRRRDILELGRGIFARSIEERLCKAHVDSSATALRPYAYALAGSLFSLLEWWVDHEMVTSPEEMDALFHRMVWMGVRETP